MLVDKKTKVIKDGFLTKEGKKANKNIEPRYVRLTRTELQWFHSQEEANEREALALGSIKFTNIYSIIPANRNKQTSDLFVECMSWRKKNKEQDRRKFVFGAKNETERDEWITCIEYLRTKNIFENFSKKFANITFPVENLAAKPKRTMGGGSNFEAPSSLGTMIKRQNPIFNTSPSVLKKGNSNIRKSSIANYLIDRKRTSSVSIDSMNMMNQENSGKDLAFKIAKLYNATSMYFFGQIKVNSLKNSILSANPISRKPGFLENVSFTEDLSYSSPSLSRININEANKTGVLTQNSESPSSMKVQMMKFKGLNNVQEKRHSQASVDTLQLKKTHSDVKSAGPDLDANLSEEYYKDLEVRKSEQAPMRLPIVKEDDDEHEMTMEIKETIVPIIAPDFNATRKDRSATFKPYNYEQPQVQKLVDNEQKRYTLGNEILEDVKQNADFKRETEQQSSEHEIQEISDDESSDKHIAEAFTVDKISDHNKAQYNAAPKSNNLNVPSRQINANALPVSYQPPLIKTQTPTQTKNSYQKIYIEEEKVDNSYFDLSQSSKKSKFTVPSSEQYDNHVENKFVSRPVDIIDPTRNPYRETETISKTQATGQLSISRMQYGITRFKNAGKDTVSTTSAQFNNPSIGTSHDFYNSGNVEAGNRRNSPYQINANFENNLVESTPFKGDKIRSNIASNSNISENSNNGVPLQNLQLPYFGAQTQPFDQNNPQGVNNFMMQMMMLMQQNTALMAQQQDLMKSVVSGSPSKSANGNSHKKQSFDELQNNYKAVRNADSKTFIQNDDYSSLNDDKDQNDDNDNIDEPENIRVASVSIERKKNVDQHMLIYKKPKRPILEEIQEQNEEPKIYNKAVAIVLNDVSCKINPNLRLLEGDIVTVERYIPELDLYQCRYDNNVGMYPKEAIKVVRKKGQKEQSKFQDNSVERRMDSLEKYASFNKDKQGEEMAILENHQDFLGVDPILQNSKYSSRNDEESTNEILPYNSLQTKEIEIIPEKRVSAPGDFSLITASVLKHYNEDKKNSNQLKTATFNSRETERQYFEPKSENLTTRKYTDERSKQNDNMFNSKYNNDISERDNINAMYHQLPNFSNGDSRVPRPAPKKAKKKNKPTNKFLNANTFIENDHGQPEANFSRLYTEVPVDNLSHINPNDSLTSSNSMNKSLKMQQRRQKRNKNKSSGKTKQTSNPTELKPRGSRMYPTGR